MYNKTKKRNFLKNKYKLMFERKFQYSERKKFYIQTRVKE